MKAGRPRKFTEPPHKFLLVLPKSLFQRVKEVTIIKSKKSITDSILDAIKLYIQ
jgi:hypothetical protein